MTKAAKEEFSGGPLTVYSEDEDMFRASVREFAEGEIRPRVEAMDEHAKMDPLVIKQLFDLGLMGVETPEEYGGAGADFFTAIIGVEELSRVDPSVGVLMDVQNTLVNNALIRWGSPEQKKKYLPRLASDTVGAYALSEAGSGSDAFAMGTKAVDRGDHYELTGQKLWITNGNEAGLFVVFANAKPEEGYKGITAFIVEKTFEGFAVGKKENKLGIRASSTTEIILDACKVPKENLLGEFGKGYKVSIETLNEGRIGIGAQMIGLARGALEHALRYTAEREQFGKAIGQFQAVQFQLAEMATDIEAARLMVYNAARLKDAGRPFVKEAAMAKLYSSRVAERVSSKAIELYGGYGFVKDYPVEKLWRDSKIGAIYEGTSNMQLQTIAKLITQGRQPKVQ
ncbi:MAG TPA: acyl-CoA dehydrogenase [Pyrinomonadaceae bacterium]|jgi:butyryl-CoA dehydrogenase/short/branched chain acyl-CoA dehydrogenase|nr:acyl-CoA dehydrogenase [Pyrinomonadaceae bacterium]